MARIVVTGSIGSIDDAALLARVFDGAEVVMRVAALHAPHVGVVTDGALQRVNVDGTAAVIAAARAAGVCRIVFTSTTALYGTASTPDGRAGWVDEQTAPQPRTIYHRTKLAAEALLREAADAAGPSVPRRDRAPGRGPRDLGDLGRDLRAPALVAAFAARGWALPARIDVYDAGAAHRELGWRPRHGWQEPIAMLDQGHAEVLPPPRRAR